MYREKRKKIGKEKIVKKGSRNLLKEKKQEDIGRIKEITKDKRKR